MTTMNAHRKMKLSEIKDKVCIEVVRDGEFESLGLITYHRPKLLTYLEDVQWLPGLLTKTNISCVISRPSLLSSLPEELGIGVSTDPRRTFYRIHHYLATETDFYWKSFKTEIAPSAKIHPTAFIAERDVRIGEECEIGPNVCILERSILRNNVKLGPGTVIGAESLQIDRIREAMIPVIQAGGVLLHNRVEMQANCCICRDVWGFTEIGEGTKLVNLVHIAHNVSIGKGCLLTACVEVSGSTQIGDYVWIAPGAIISNALVIGDGANITIGSVVTKDVAPGQRVTGNFAIDHKKFIAFMRKIR